MVKKTNHISEIYKSEIFGCVIFKILLIFSFNKSIKEKYLLLYKIEKQTKNRYINFIKEKNIAPCLVSSKIVWNFQALMIAMILLLFSYNTIMRATLKTSKIFKQKFDYLLKHSSKEHYNFLNYVLNHELTIEKFAEAELENANNNIKILIKFLEKTKEN